MYTNSYFENEQKLNLRKQLNYENNIEKLNKYSSCYKNLQLTGIGGLQDDQIEHLLFMNKCMEIVKPKEILEIGFNFGGSALTYLLFSNSNLTSVDINYNKVSIDYLKSTFGERFNFLQSNSGNLLNTTVNKFYDLIYIDGDHSENAVIRDLNICLEMNPDYIQFDDVFHPVHLYIERIIKQCNRLEIVELLQIGCGVCLTKVKK